MKKNTNSNIVYGVCRPRWWCIWASALSQSRCFGWFCCLVPYLLIKYLLNMIELHCIWITCMLYRVPCLEVCLYRQISWLVWSPLLPTTHPLASRRLLTRVCVVIGIRVLMYKFVEQFLSFVVNGTILYDVSACHCCRQIHTGREAKEGG